jgi:hypothetical protein
MCVDMDMSLGEDDSYGEVREDGASPAKMIGVEVMDKIVV